MSKFKFVLSVCFLSIPLFFALCLSSTEAQAASPEGRWRGGWSSESTGHKGTLRARVRPSGPDSYKAVFTGRFAVVIPFIYRADLKQVPGTCDCYTSTKKLPLLGTYRMTANVSQNRLYAVFQGKKDKGVFQILSF